MNVGLRVSPKDVGSQPTYKGWKVIKCPYYDKDNPVPSLPTRDGKSGSPPRRFPCSACSQPTYKGWKGVNYPGLDRSGSVPSLPTRDGKWYKPSAEMMHLLSFPAYLQGMESPLVLGSGLQMGQEVPSLPTRDGKFVFSLRLLVAWKVPSLPTRDGKIFT